MDSDGSGSITVEEMERALREQGSVLSQEELQALVAGLDADRNGVTPCPTTCHQPVHLQRLRRGPRSCMVSNTLKQLKTLANSSRCLTTCSEMIGEIRIFRKADVCARKPVIGKVFGPPDRSPPVPVRPRFLRVPSCGTRLYDDPTSKTCAYVREAR